MTGWNWGTLELGVSDKHTKGASYQNSKGSYKYSCLYMCLGVCVTQRDGEK